MTITEKQTAEVNTVCWILPKSPFSGVLLGRNGDGIIMLPAFMEIHRRTGLKPRIIVVREYAGIYDGVSYVEPYIIDGHWYNSVGEAKKLAEEMWGDAIIPQFWQLPPDKGDEIGFADANMICIQCHGIQHGVNMALDPNFMTSMWRRCGFTREEMMTLPLVFDRRSPEREANLISRLKRGNKPMLLINFSGISSPFKYSSNVMRLLTKFLHKFQVIDIGSIRAERIYDLLGLYDAAAGLITTDTSTLHLAQGSKVKYIALTVDGWCSAVPRGNCILEVKYSQTMENMDELSAAIESL